MRLGPLVVLSAALVAACEKLPDRPDETSFRAMDDYEKCRVTASRAIMCTDELLAAQLRALTGSDGTAGMADLVEQDLAKDRKMPKQERKQNIAVHKSSCAADAHYPHAVFSCWRIEDCKSFAACVVEKPATRPSK